MRNRIKAFLDSKGITRYRFRQDCGIAQRTAYDLYDKPEQLPSSTVLEKICDTYRIQPGEILEWVPPELRSDRAPLPSDPEPKSEPTQKQGKRRATAKDSSSSTQSFLIGDCVRLPSGDRAFVTGFKNERVLVKWEVGQMDDDFPPHLLSLVCQAA